MCLLGVPSIRVLASILVCAASLHSTRLPLSKPRQLQVIVAGLPKTATSSVVRALSYLGYPICHGPCTRINRNSEGLKQWNRTGDVSQRVEELLSLKVGDAIDVFSEEELQSANFSSQLRDMNFVGVSDVPLCYKYRELLELNPQAKVILSVHPGGPEAWLKSALTYSTDLRSPVGHFVIDHKLYPSLAFELMYTETQKALFPCDLVHPQIDTNESMQQLCMETYAKWEEDVQREVSPENFLRFNVSDGWEPLATFLGAEAPGIPFPERNTHTEGHQVLRDDM